MRWTPGGESNDIEDRRGSTGGGLGKGLGLGGTVVVLILSVVFGHNFFNDVGAGGNGATAVDSGAPASASGDVGPVQETPVEHRRVQFVSFVLDDVQHEWEQILPAADGVPYRHAKLVLFRDAVRSGCGVAQTAMGPFYCPVDEKAYIDLSFYDELRDRFGAKGDLAQAYVLAHELGHHVQHLLGTDAKVRQLQRDNPDAANALSVRLELQADCYAGVWASTTQQRHLLDPGDFESALTAAAAVGDDRIQRAETGTVHPEAFTHGTAAQRSSWLRKGFTAGQPQACDTFAGLQ